MKFHHKALDTQQGSCNSWAPGVGNDKFSSRDTVKQKGLPNINSKGKMSNLYKKLLSSWHVAAG